MKTIITTTVLVFLLIINTGCGNNGKNVINNDEGIKIDTSFVYNNVNYVLKVTGVVDLKNNYVKNGNHDATENDVIEDDDEYWLENSTNLTIEILDENNKFGKSFAIVNIDILKAFVKNSIDLNGFLLSDRIEFIGVTSKGLAMFKLHTYWGGGDGGGQDWVIGMEINQREWNKDYQGKKESHMAVCLIEVLDYSGTDFHFKNSKYLIGDFIGSWNFDCSDGGFGNLEIAKNEKYIHLPVNSNQIYLNARYELKSEKLSLYLNYETGIEFGSFGVGGASLPWDDYSREKPIGEISSIKNQPDKINFKWYGFYNVKLKKYEWGPPEFVNVVEGKVKSQVLNRCK